MKEIEAKTNHDVKAVEYFLKEQFDKHEILKARKEYLHFTCTSEDINNLAYGMMIKGGVQGPIDAKLEKLQNVLNENFAKKYAECAMMSRTHG